MDYTLIKNILYNIVLKISDFIFPLITYSYVARVLTPTGTGKVAFVNSILTYFYYLAVLGIPTYGMRECSKVRNNKEQLSDLVQEILFINIISMICAYGLLLVSVFSSAKLWEYRELFFVMSISIFLNSIGAEWLYKALEEYAYITKRSLIFKCISVGLIFALVHSKEDYLIYGFLSVFTGSASNICNFFYMRKYVSLKKRKRYEIRKHIKPIIILFSASIIITIYANFDTSMIGFIDSEKEVGIYNAAIKVEGAIFAFVSAMSSSMIPKITNYFSMCNMKKIQELLVILIRIALCCTIPVIIFIYFFSDNVLLLIFGEEYLEASKTLKVLMVCIIPLILSNLFGNAVLIPMGMEKRYTQSVFIGMIINLILNMMLIPSMGAFGAAIGTLFTEIWNACYMSGGVKNIRRVVFRKIKLIIYPLTYLISIFITSLFYRCVIHFSLLFRIILPFCIYLLITFALLAFFREPLIFSFFKKFKIVRDKKCN